jgi:DUF1365 family protein
MTASALYFSGVMHKRLLPFRHRFDYRVVTLLADLDELPDLARRLRLFSLDRFNVFSFHRKDHGPRDGSPLRPWMDARLKEAGIDLDGGPVRLIAYPRVWGYAFNPLTVWFCYHRDGTLRAVNYEVSNTFGQHHHYLIPVPPGHTSDKALHQGCRKDFHVSPFIPIEGGYAFRVTEPGDRQATVIRQHVDAGEILVASQVGRRAELTDRNLLRALAGHPLMTFKVIAAIHWQALKLWRRGARFHTSPAPPETAVTIVDPRREAAE